MSTNDKSIFQVFKDIKNNIKSIFLPHNVQIGSNSSPKEINLIGRFSITPIQYDFTLQNSNISLTNNTSIFEFTLNDDIISSSLTPIIYLPQQPRDGQIISIKNIDGNLSLKDVIIQTTNNSLIDNSTSLSLLEDYQSISLYWKTNKWNLLSSTPTWHTILEEDFSSLESQTFPTDNFYTINNRLWAKGGSSYETGTYTTNITKNIGLMFSVANTSNKPVYPVMTCPYLAISLNDLYPHIKMSTPLEISMMFPTSSGIGSSTYLYATGYGITSALSLTGSTTRNSNYILSYYQDSNKFYIDNSTTTITSNTTLSSITRYFTNSSLILSCSLSKISFPDGFIPGNYFTYFYNPQNVIDWKENINDYWLSSFGSQHNHITSSYIVPFIHGAFNNPNTLFFNIFALGLMTNWTQPPAITKIRIRAFY